MRARFVLSEVGNGLRRNLTMTIAVIITVGVSLALFGVALLVRSQVDTLTTRLPMRRASPVFSTRSCVRLLRLLSKPSVATRSLTGVPYLVSTADPAAVPFLAIAAGISVDLLAAGSSSCFEHAPSAQAATRRTRKAAARLIRQASGVQDS